MRKYLPILLLWVTTAAYAQTTKVVIQKATAQVYTSPSASSEVLVTLKKGSAVELVSSSSDGVWAKVKVVISGFQFDGWIQKSAITKPSTSASAKTPPATKPTGAAVTGAAAASSLSTSSTSDLDKYFEPSSGPGAQTAPPPAAAPAKVEEAPPPTTSQTKDKKEKKSQPRQDENSWSNDRLIVYGRPGFSFLQYTLNDSTQDAFRYNISGPSIEAGVEYRFISLMDNLIHLGAQLNVQYIFMNTKTNLLDTTNTQFGDVTAHNSLLDIWIKAKILFNFEELVEQPFLLGLTFGYDYMKFSGDDIVDDTGVPVGLFVDQTTMNFPVGLVGELHYLDPVLITLGFDALVLGSASESPSGSSGDAPSPGVGIAPYFKLDFPIANEHHFMGFMYQLKFQETDFTGDSSVRANKTLTDATAIQTLHTLGLQYAYHF